MYLAAHCGKIDIKSKYISHTRLEGGFQWPPGEARKRNISGDSSRVIEKLQNCRVHVVFGYSRRQV